MADTAKRLLKDYGEPVYFSDSSSSYDPVTDTVTTSSVSYDGYGYLGRYGSQDIDGTVIRQDDSRLIVELLPERPLKGWKVEVDNKTFEVVNVRSIRVSGGDIMYICQVRTS